MMPSGVIPPPGAGVAGADVAGVGVGVGDGLSSGALHPPRPTPARIAAAAHVFLIFISYPFVESSLCNGWSRW